MTRSTVTAKGQIALRQDLLRHLGVRPGQKIEAVERPGGRIEFRALQPAGSIEGFIGLLEGKTRKVSPIEDMIEAAARGWAGEE